MSNAANANITVTVSKQQTATSQDNTTNLGEQFYFWATTQSVAFQ